MIKVGNSDMWLSIVRLIAVGILPECIIDIDTYHGDLGAL